MNIIRTIIELITIVKCYDINDFPHYAIIFSKQKLFFFFFYFFRFFTSGFTRAKTRKKPIAIIKKEIKT